MASVREQGKLGRGGFGGRAGGALTGGALTGGALAGSAQLDSDPPPSGMASAVGTRPSGLFSAGEPSGRGHDESGEHLRGAAESGQFRRAVDWSNPRVLAILETASTCFSRGGFTATTLADIGGQLGLRKSIVHYYFASKAALVHEVQSFAYGRYLSLIRNALAPSGGAQTLWKELANTPAIRGLNIELWSEGRRDPELAAQAGALRDEARRTLSDHFEESRGLPREAAEDLSTLTIAVLDGLTVLAEEAESRARAESPTASAELAEASARQERAYQAFLRLLDRA